MKKHTIVLALIAALAAAPIELYATPAQEKSAQEIALLFRASRKVIADHQDLINDAAKADKGLGATVVVAKAKENYQAAAGKPLDESDPMLTAMLGAIGAVITEAQPLINEKGKAFKGFLPAVFARQVAERTTEKFQGKLFIKLTAPKDYLRNRSNRPDEWETAAMESKFRTAGWEKGRPLVESTTHKGKTGLRLAIPEYYGESCLSCHGGPKGERDITGGIKEGALLGELGGAISVVIYDN